MSKLTTDEQLDAILFFIQDKTSIGAMISRNYIWDLYVSRTPELGITPLLFSDILQHLIDDGYIILSNNTYHLTVKGRNFKGYVEYNKFYRKVLRNPIGQTVIATIIISIIVWAFNSLRNSW